MAIIRYLEQNINPAVIIKKIYNFPISLKEFSEK